MLDVKILKSAVEAQRDLILSKLKRLKKEDPFRTEDRSIIVEPGTDAAVLFGHEQVVIFEEKLKKDLVEIEKALSKIKKGTYGYCERCKRAIDPGRLAVKPHAVYCLKCESELEKKK